MNQFKKQINLKIIKTMFEQEQIKTLQQIKNNDISLVSLHGVKTIGKVVEMYDGDTCKIILIHNNNIEKYNCRLFGIDTPEMKPSLLRVCRQEEIIKAYQCRNRLLQLVTDNVSWEIDSMMSKKQVTQLLEQNTKIVDIECFEFDKYGRLLVKLYSDSEKSANEILCEENYAKLYYGGTK
jgi:endonuclease YncB( thermonuclease family)